MTLVKLVATSVLGDVLQRDKTHKVCLVIWYLLCLRGSFLW